MADDLWDKGLHAGGGVRAVVEAVQPKAKAPEWLYWLGVIRNNYSKVLGAFVKALYELG